MKYKIQLFVSLFFLSCQISTAARYIINGHLSGFSDSVKVFLLDNESESVLDSTLLIKGKFHLKGNLEQGPMYLSIKIQDAKEDYETLVFLGLGTVSISGNKNDFPYKISVNGSSEQGRYNEYMTLIRSLNIKADSVWLAYSKQTGDAKMKAGLAYNKIGDEKQLIEKKWILNNSDTYYAVNQYYGLLPDLTIDSIKRFYTKLSINKKNSIYGKRIYDYITKGDTLKRNDKYYDFIAYDKSGNKLRLSSFCNKYILLDFSSVACGPCRESIDELIKLSKNYKGNLNIVTFTLDKRSDWLQEIKDDKLTWVSLIDPQGSYSKTLFKYNIRSIPTFYLISPNGVILDKWTGYEKSISSPSDLESHLISNGLDKISSDLFLRYINELQLNPKL